MNVEYRNQSGFQKFFNRVQDKIIALMYDVNTTLYAEQLKIELFQYVKEILSIRQLFSV